MNVCAAENRQPLDSKTNGRPESSSPSLPGRFSAESPVALSYQAKVQCLHRCQNRPDRWIQGTGGMNDFNSTAT
jgi:hypothetical protein